MTKCVTKFDHYAGAVANAKTKLFKHPTMTTAQRLHRLLPLAERFQVADFYGQGGVVEALEQRIAQCFGHQAALFMPSGTMAQNIALRIWSEEKSLAPVALHPQSHLELHEQGAYHSLFGLHSVSFGKRDHLPTVDDVASLRNQVSVALWELPARELGGALPSWSELQQQVSLARKRGIRCHLDGARVWSVANAYQCDLTRIGDLFDSIYVSFYKDLDGIAGAALIGDSSFIDTAKIWQRRCGGNLITQFPDALAAWYGLEYYLPRMPQYVRVAQQVAAMFAEHACFSLVPEKVQSNLFHLIVRKPVDRIMESLFEMLQQHKLALLPMPRETKLEHCRFEVTIGESVNALSLMQWRDYIAKLAQTLEA